jgi:hypothetical protein
MDGAAKLQPAMKRKRGRTWRAPQQRKKNKKMQNKKAAAYVVHSIVLTRRILR